MESVRDDADRGRYDRLEDDDLDADIYSDLCARCPAIYSVNGIESDPHRIDDIDDDVRDYVQAWFGLDR